MDDDYLNPSTSAVQKNMENAEVLAVFQTYPQPLRDCVLSLRSVILETAASTDGVGRVEEALRWGEPSYLTPETKSGTTIRIAPFEKSDRQYALFVSCQTTLVDTYRQTYGDLFTYSGARAMVFDVEDDIPVEALSHCIALALRYHVDKRRGT